MIYGLQRKSWRIINKRKIEIDCGQQINTSNKSRMNAEIQDGKQQVAHLKGYIKMIDGKLIEEVEERTRLQKRNQTLEECCAEWCGLSERQLERIEELKKELAELKEQMKFLDLDGKPCDRCSEPVCYEGNEGKISKRDDCVICEECYAREEVEDNPNHRERRFWVKPKTGILKD